MANAYLESTTMLNYPHPDIQALIIDHGWRELPTYDAIGAIYTFVRDQIAFGYNSGDTITAAKVLKDGYGQCNTKGTLLMALLRAVGIPCRVHGFTIYNDLQKGAIPIWLFSLAPERILHSWVEVQLDGKWINLEGYIIDAEYLGSVQRSLADQCEAFSGYGIATPCLANPKVDWQGEDTYIQREGIADDFGIFTSPDEFYRGHQQPLGRLKSVLYRWVIRHLMNANVRRIRRKGIPQPKVPEPQLK